MVGRTAHHGLVATLTLLVTGGVAVTIGLVDTGTVLLVPSKTDAARGS